MKIMLTTQSIRAGSPGVYHLESLTCFVCFQFYMLRKLAAFTKGLPFHWYRVQSFILSCILKMFFFFLRLCLFFLLFHPWFFFAVSFIDFVHSFLLKDSSSFIHDFPSFLHCFRMSVF
ncbi:hypothetical protein DFS34DRAFT_626886 [Phlyctochytrium arcticum]|nr:hypothetical protein DFS34DRAFT_626886 [Phlyctochytrium arcticum]